MNHGKYITKELFGILITVSFALLVTSCSPSTSPKAKKASINDTTTLSAGAHPGLGTSYTDSAYLRDTNLNIIPSTGTRIVYTLVDTNVSIGGKQNVYEFTSAVDTIYLHYEANGDYNYYVRFGLGSIQIGSEWVTFTGQAQGTIPITALSYPIPGDTIQITGSTKGQGIGSAQIGKEAISAGRVLMSADAYAVKMKTHGTNAITVFFAQGLGFFTWYDVSTSGNFAGTNLGGGVHRFLIDYDLK